MALHALSGSLAAIASISSGTGIGGLVGTILWVLCLVWIYNIAKRKGRHPILWLILGFFFSYLALIVLALLPSKRATDRWG